MFKRQLLRQARVCRGVRASPSSMLSLGSGAAPRPSTTYRPALLAASVSRQIISRSYSDATAAAESRTGGGQSGPITRFADLAPIGVHDNILRAILEDMQYETMTDVQAMSINPALQGKDIVAQARTGTGKTLGFLVPTISRIIQKDPSLASRSLQQARADDIRAIIISPTRELAEQIGAEARKLCRHTGVKVQTAVGGMNKAMMLRKTRHEGCHLLVATPGRLFDLLSDEYSGIDAPNVQALVLDEADRMLDVGFDKELQQIVRLLPNRREKPRQTLLFSATIPKDVVQIARVYVDASNFQFVQTINADEAPTHEKVPQHIVPVPGFEHYMPTLLEIIEKAQNGEHGSDPFKAIVFFNQTALVKLIDELFQYLPRYMKTLPPSYAIHSGLDQRDRTRAADNFRKAQSGILISSDVTARGMDFPNVTHVIQFGVPPSREQYIHRLGRTGRANKSGQGWIIIRKEEINDARRKLPGLPIKRNDTLECAAVDARNTDAAALPRLFALVTDGMRRVRKGLVREVYEKFLNPHGRQVTQDLVDSANFWTKSQCGFDTPPAVSQSLTRIVPGLGRVQGINFMESGESRGGGGGYGSGRGGGFGGGRGGGGFGGRGQRENRDPFAQISSRGRDDRPQRRERAGF
ncbi:ATP-dependent RNA helicase cyt-19, mitochondrial [Cytospora mali]|uniref:ATP-dependent RNA helicase n=1 Tax=Cytospora mali TaxID=578113 RepID=A0A194V9U3_CYTMA|nr:ATP-dependent RNA helicase cyt-19, mitochondrial [Valsa mali var. pyri (nom. inval.)]